METYSDHKHCNICKDILIEKTKCDHSFDKVLMCDVLTRLTEQHQVTDSVNISCSSMYHIGVRTWMLFNIFSSPKQMLPTKYITPVLWFSHTHISRSSLFCVSCGRQESSTYTELRQWIFVLAWSELLETMLKQLPAPKFFTTSYRPVTRRATLACLLYDWYYKCAAKLSVTCTLTWEHLAHSTACLDYS